MSQQASELLELPKDDNILWLQDWRCMGFRPEWREFDWKWIVLDWDRYFKGYGECCIRDSIKGGVFLLLLVMVWHFGLGALMGLLLSLFCNGFVMSTEALTIHGNGCKCVYLQHYILCLAVGARAVIQINPEHDAQMTMLKSAALQAGYISGIPDSTKAKKTYLVLDAGPILAKNSTVKNCQVIQEDHVKESVDN